MTTPPRTALFSLAIAVGAAAAFAMAPGGAAASSAEAADAAEVVHWMQAAPATVWFTGDARVTWHDRGERRSLTVSVVGDHGALEVRAGGATVLEYGSTTYVKGVEGDPGWSTALLWPKPAAVPEPDHNLVLRVRDGTPVAGRPTRMVEGARRGGAAALRLYADDATGLLLRRDVLDGDGRLVRSFAFVDLTVDDGPALRAPADARGRRGQALGTVPDGYVAPDEAAGFVLVGRVRDGDRVELLYHDGLFAVSVRQQRGALDWDALPRGGDATEVDGRRARRYAQPGADVVVWERDGTVFTLVTDAPADVVESLAGEFAPGRSTAEKIVKYVLGPFAWG